MGDGVNRVSRRVSWAAVRRYAEKMKYVLVSEQKQEALPGGKGVCRRCGGDVIAKCGSRRVHHWAHRGKRECDSWWEPETEWHRRWKNNFPIEYQEFIQYDEQSGEKHIADVRTPHGLVIEFQHSHLDLRERAARERFYGNMLWVVDGTRLKRDLPRFLKGKEDLRRTEIPGHFLHAFPEECFPAMWLDSSVPVVFDFRGVDELESPDISKEALWCLLPSRVDRHAVVIGMSRSQFIATVPTRPQLVPVREIVALFTQRRMEMRAADGRRLAMSGPRRGRRPSRRF